ncbi:glutathione transferase [Sarracenia purpurea var. burkii]
MGGGGAVKLIGGKSSFFCARVEWALKLKGVKYEYVEEDVKNKSPLLLKLNPVHKKIPVLVVHGDKPIAESLVILEYIDEAWKENPLLPQDPAQKAVARFWAKFNDEKCVLGAWNACLAEGEKKAAAIESAKESLAFLEKQIEGKPFFGGENIGFLDLVIGWLPLWLGVMEECGEMKLMDAEEFPFLHAWAHNFVRIPPIQECSPPKEELVAYFRPSLSYVRSLAANNQ